MSKNLSVRNVLVISNLKLNMEFLSEECGVGGEESLALLVSFERLLLMSSEQLRKKRKIFS